EGVEVEHRAVAALPDELASALRRPLDSLLDSPLTQTGVLVGTPAYMAPEQFAGRVPDARSDQFAFAVTAWEALTGARPFAGDTLPALEQAVAAGARINEDALPRPVREVLTRGLAVSPAARWPDLPALLAAFAEATAAPAPRARAARRRRWWLVAAGAGALVAGVSIALVAGTGGGRGAGEECADAEEAFGDAWSESAREKVSRAHRGGNAIGAIVLFDAARTGWLEVYRDVCAEPPSTERVAGLACLRRTRDQIAELSRQVAVEGADIPMGRIGLLAVDVARCDPDPAAFRIPTPPEPPQAPGPVPPAPR
ncbi:MAG TPA: protein kinase, partial [Kofleriaceae bacterium]|nr:protein kinase [Kofleriaceae bacterium]